MDRSCDERTLDRSLWMVVWFGSNGSNVEDRPTHSGSIITMSLVDHPGSIFDNTPDADRWHGAEYRGVAAPSMARRLRSRSGRNLIAHAYYCQTLTSEGR